MEDVDTLGRDAHSIHLCLVCCLIILIAFCVARKVCSACEKLVCLATSRTWTDLGPPNNQWKWHKWCPVPSHHVLDTCFILRMWQQCSRPRDTWPRRLKEKGKRKSASGACLAQNAIVLHLHWKGGVPQWHSRVGCSKSGNHPDLESQSKTLHPSPMACNRL